ncbi:MAG: glycosyltransferase [Bacteroidetes bacterium]|nr:glycosyltransferase [Bacteroidota bacterium]
MRIALIGPTYPFRGGISHHTTLLAKELTEEHTLKFVSFTRQYPQILFPGESDKDPSLKPLLSSDVDYLIDSLNPLTLISAARSIARFQPDLVILPWWVTFWSFHYRFLCSKIKRCTEAEIVFLCHNVIEHESTWVKKWLTRFALKGADRFVTQSIGETDKLKIMLGDNVQVRTAFHPTYADLSHLKTVSKENAKASLGISSQMLLFFGFVRPYKGLETLLNAMPDIVKERDVTLIIAGEFWKDREEYIALIDKYELNSHIQIHDRYIANEDISLFFAAADLVVQPYQSVTGSGVLQLAYGYEIPVVATNIGSLSEIITDRVDGRLVQPNDPKSLAKAIVESLGDEELIVLKKNAKLVNAKFSWNNFIKFLCE